MFDPFETFKLAVLVHPGMHEHPSLPTPPIVCCCLCRFTEMLMVYYPVQVGLGMFIIVGGLLVAAFLGYLVGGEQAYMVGTVLSKKSESDW